MEIRVDIVLATTEMSVELARIKKQVWETTYKNIYPKDKLNNYSIEKESNKFLKLILSPSIKLYVAKLNDEVVGYMAIGKSPRRPDLERDEIVLLYILKKYQGLGIGKHFFNLAKDQLQQKNPDYFYVFCNKYNHPALSFYQRMGCKTLSIDEDNPDKSIPQTKLIYYY